MASDLVHFGRVAFAPTPVEQDPSPGGSARDERTLKPSMAGAALAFLLLCLLLLV